MKQFYTPEEREYFRKQVDFVNFVKSHGFEDTSKSTKKYPRLKDQGGDIVILCQNSEGVQHYFSPTSGTKGDILDFTINYILPSIEENQKRQKFLRALDYLTQYKEKGEVIELQGKSVLAIADLDKKIEAKQFYQKLTPLTEDTLTYFKKRGIEEWVVKHPMFNKNIFNSKYVDKGGKTHSNVAYLMHDQTGLCCVTLKNVGFSGARGDRQGLALAFPKEQEQIDSLFLTEGYEDAMAHFQMNHEKFKEKNIAYASIQGALTPKQVYLIEEIYKKGKVGEIVTLFDRDPAGKMYTINLLGKLNLQESLFARELHDGNYNSLHFMEVKGHIENNPNRTANNGVLDISLIEDTKKDAQKFVEQIKNKFQSLNESFKETTTSEMQVYEVRSENIKQLNKRYAVNIEIEFLNKAHFWDNVIQDFLIKERYQNRGVGIEIPFSTDFNHDLKITKGMDKNLRVNEINGEKVLVKIGKKEPQILGKMKEVLESRNKEPKNLER